MPPTDVNPVVAEPSAAATAVPQEVELESLNGEQYSHWQKTGELPTPKTADPAPATEDPDSPSGAGEESAESAPASEAGKPQEPKGGKRDAESRIRQLIAEKKELEEKLKTTGKPPDAKPAEPSPAKAPETQPKALEEPKEPKLDDFKTYEEFEAANRTYARALAKYEAAQAVENFKQEQQRAAANREMQERVAAARTRYPDLDSVLPATAGALYNDAQIPAVVKHLANESPVLVDVLYKLGSEPAELQAFLNLARTDPGAAIRKFIQLEQTFSGTASESKQTPERDATGKFQTTEKTAVKDKVPEKKISGAPPPAKEVGGKGTPPADEVEAALESDDFAAYNEAMNRRDIARRKG